MTARLTRSDGEPVVGNGTQNFKGCRDSEFDQYGDVAAFGLYPEVCHFLERNLIPIRADDT